MRRFLVLFLLLICLIFGIAGCGGADASDVQFEQAPVSFDNLLPSDTVSPSSDGGQTLVPEGTSDGALNAEVTAAQPQEQNSAPGAEASTPTSTQQALVNTTEGASQDTQDSQVISPPPAITDDEPVVLTIFGDGVSRETTWTLSRLQSMREGYRENIYSTTNNWPAFGHTAAHGISLPYLLRQAEMINSAESFVLTAADGYRVTATYDQIFGTRYAYAEHSREGSGGASSVEAILAWEWGEEGGVRPEDLRSFFGQCGPMEVNTSYFVASLIRIEVLNASQGTWDIPGASIADGSEVTFGTELRLLHDNMDNLRIYYTLDGSVPDYNSTVYNRSTSFFQPQLITPIFLAESVTVKAFAAGFGRDPSDVVTFSYIVESES